MEPGPPRLAPRPDGSASVHATAVAAGGRALLICGPAGAGKSGLAAEMLALGAGLVADDLCLLEPDGPGLSVARPPGRPPLLELRGLGLVPAGGPPRAPLAGVWLLGPSPARLPPPATVALLGRAVPCLRHPARPGAAAKALLWLRAGGADAGVPGDPGDGAGDGTGGG